MKKCRTCEVLSCPGRTMSPDDPDLGKLLIALMGAGMPVGVPSFGQPPLGDTDLTMIGINTGSDMSMIAIGPDGKVVRQRHGSRTEEILLRDVAGIDSSAVAAWDEVGTLAVKIEGMRTEAQQLRDEARRLQDDINDREIILKFDIADSLPAEQADRYGDDGLEVREDDERVILYDTDRLTNVTSLKDAVGRQLLESQQQIGADKESAQSMNERAALLERQVRSLPELLQQRKRRAALHSDHITNQCKTMGAVGLMVAIRKDGTPVVVIERSIDEEGDEVPNDEMALLKAIVALTTARGKQIELSPGVRKLLDIPDPATPEIEAPAVATESVTATAPVA